MSPDRIDTTIEVDNTANLGDSGIGKSETLKPLAPDEIVPTYIGNPLMEADNGITEIIKGVQEGVDKK